MRNQPHKPNSSDIAQLAGVSRSTVSRVVNGYANVPEPTRRRVMEVIDRFGYVPSVSGQTLRGMHARCVGVFQGEHGWQAETQAALLYAFSECAQSLGYMTLSGRVGAFGSPGNDREIRQVLCSGCVDAGVFFNAAGGDTLIRQLLREGQTIGAIGMASGSSHDRLFTVELNPDITREAVNYALSQGHRRAVLLGDSGSFADGGKMFERFFQTAADAGLYAYRPTLGETMTIEQQADAALNHRDRPRLLICADQAAAGAAYRAVYARGLTIGRDVSILGMGLFPTDLPLWPTLAAFRFDPKQMIASLVTRLIQAMESDDEVQRHEKIPFEWLEGRSCIRYSA